MGVATLQPESHMNADRNAEIIRRRNAGEPFTSIASSLGITKNTAIGVYHRSLPTKRGRTIRRGEEVGNAKLSDAAIREIRRLRAIGEKLEAIGALFDVHYSTISLICLRKRWAHVDLEGFAS